MRRRSKAILFALGVVFTGCSHTKEHPIPVLAERTLYVSKDLPGLEYRYQMCIESFLGACFEAEDRKEYYDLRDEKVRQFLINAGFVVHTKLKCFEENQ